MTGKHATSTVRNAKRNSRNSRLQKPRRRKMLGKHIVSDPEIRAGRPTFVGTRIMVTNVLELVAEGLDWDRIVWEFNNHITREGIAEAVAFACRILMERDNRILSKSMPA